MRNDDIFPTCECVSMSLAAELDEYYCCFVFYRKNKVQKIMCTVRSRNRTISMLCNNCDWHSYDDLIGAVVYSLVKGKYISHRFSVLLSFWVSEWVRSVDPTYPNAWLFVLILALSFILASMIKIVGILTVLFVVAHALAPDERKSILNFHTQVRSKVQPSASNMMFMVSNEWVRSDGIPSLALLLFPPSFQICLVLF